MAVFLAVALAVLIARIERSCACASLTCAARCVVTPRVAMLAAAGVMMTAKAAPSETYQQNRAEANETVKH